MDKEDDRQHVQQERPARGVLAVCKNREKMVLAFVLWLNIPCNMLVFFKESSSFIH
jgi:hypothetical protein